MLIPEFSKAPSSEFTQIETAQQFKEMRSSVTDKAIVLLVTASWNEQSQMLKEMAREMPSSYPSVKLCWFDCDELAELVDQFEVD